MIINNTENEPNNTINDKQRSKLDEVGCNDLLAKEMPALQQTAFLFAARYTHSRSTGGTLAITRALAMVWDQLSEHTRKQIETEAYKEATENRDDWERFFHWADHLPDYLS